MALNSQQADKLAQTLVSQGGYNQIDARNAAYGSRGEELAREFGVSGMTSPSDSVNQIIEDSFAKLNKEVAQRFGEYKANRPFRLDEVLAAKANEAREQIDPYYNETLSDYITGIERKIGRGTQDTRDLLSELQADTSSFSRDLQFSLEQSINKAREGFDGAGLFDSGARYREEGLATRGAQDQLGDFTRRQNFRQDQLQTGLGRNLEDLGLQRKQNVRDIERSRFTDISTRQSQLAKEEGQKFITGFRATLPPQLQANSGFDLLQDLGIYS